MIQINLFYWSVRNKIKGYVGIGRSVEGGLQSCWREGEDSGWERVYGEAADATRAVQGGDIGSNRRNISGSGEDRVMA